MGSRYVEIFVSSADRIPPASSCQKGKASLANAHLLTIASSQKEEYHPMAKEAEVAEEEAVEALNQGTGYAHRVATTSSPQGHDAVCAMPLDHIESTSTTDERQCKHFHPVLLCLEVFGTCINICPLM